MDGQKTTTEEFKISSEDVVKKVKEIIAAGNARRVIIKSEKGDTLIEIPVTFAVAGALLVPALAAVGAVAAIVGNCTVVVEKRS